MWYMICLQWMETDLSTFQQVTHANERSFRLKTEQTQHIKWLRDVVLTYAVVVSVSKNFRWQRRQFFYLFCFNFWYIFLNELITSTLSKKPRGWKNENSMWFEYFILVHNDAQKSTCNDKKWNEAKEYKKNRHIENRWSFFLRIRFVL